MYKHLYRNYQKIGRNELQVLFQKLIEKCVSMSSNMRKEKKSTMRLVFCFFDVFPCYNFITNCYVFCFLF